MVERFCVLSLSQGSVFQGLKSLERVEDLDFRFGVYGCLEGEDSGAFRIQVVKEFMVWRFSGGGQCKPYPKL